MRTITCLLSVALIVGLVPRSEASSILGCPIVIDDFTQGALPPANGPFEFTHVGLPAQNCAGGSRHVVIDDVPGHLAGMVALGGGDIGYHLETSQHGGDNNVFAPDVLLDYAMAQPLDLTAGGLNDRLVLDVLTVSYVSVFVYIDGTGGAMGTTLLLQPGINTVFFSDLPAVVDLTQVSRLRFFFHEYSASGASELTLARIRALGDGGRYLYWSVPELIEIGPPFPLPGPLMDAAVLGDDGELVQTAALAVQLESAILLPAGTGFFPTSMRSSDSGPGRGRGLSAGVELVEAAAGKSSHSDGAFEFSVAAESFGDRFPAGIVLQETQNPEAGKTFHIPFDVALHGADGAPLGTNTIRLRVQVADDVPYQMTDLRVVPPDSVTPVFRFSFELHDDGTAGKLDAGQRLFDIAIDGDFLPYAAPTAASPLVARSELTLLAAPSVVSDRTVLRLSRGLDRAGSLRIYDLAGRAVRTLALVAGQEILTWDARDDFGRPVASAVYVARVDVGRDVATRKLVVVH